MKIVPQHQTLFPSHPLKGGKSIKIYTHTYTTADERKGTYPRGVRGRHTRRGMNVDLDYFKSTPDETRYSTCFRIQWLNTQKLLDVQVQNRTHRLRFNTRARTQTRAHDDASQLDFAGDMKHHQQQQYKSYHLSYVLLYYVL